MNKELLDKYSKISVILIAVILVISFIGVAYSKVWIPYEEQFSQERQDQKYLEASKKRQENEALLDKCYADAQAASGKRRNESCTTKPDDKAYFYCSTDFFKSNLETEQTERKNCKAKYPLNF